MRFGQRVQLHKLRARDDARLARNAERLRRRARRDRRSASLVSSRSPTRRRSSATKLASPCSVSIPSFLNASSRIGWHRIGEGSLERHERRPVDRRSCPLCQTRACGSPTTRLLLRRRAPSSDRSRDSARAAKGLIVDHRHAPTCRSALGCGCRPRRAGTEHDKIKMICHLPFSARSTASIRSRNQTHRFCPSLQTSRSP